MRLVTCICIWKIAESAYWSARRRKTIAWSLLKDRFGAIVSALGVKIPIKTQGWINSSLLDITVKDGKMSGGHMSGKNQSTVIYKYMNQLIEAVGKDV